MKKILLWLVLMLPMASQAQFFDFRFENDPFSSRRQRTEAQPYQQPEFKGGEDGLRKFMQKNWRNQKDVPAVDGKIVVACYITEKGRVTATEFVKKLQPALDEEARRICLRMKFKPAKRGKKKIRSRYDIAFPIRHGRLNFSDLPTTDL